jgi:hypothetical protein
MSEQSWVVVAMPREDFDAIFDHADGSPTSLSISAWDRWRTLADLSRDAAEGIVDKAAQSFEEDDA